MMESPITVRRMFWATYNPAAFFPWCEKIRLTPQQATLVRGAWRGYGLGISA